MAPLSIEAHSERPIAPEAVRHLYTAVGWWPERSLATIAALLDRSIAVGAWRGDDLVGFARAVTDDHARAYIEDAAVLLTNRRNGIGTTLLTALLEQLRHIETISLFCERDLVSWYERAGFAPRASQTVMHRKRQAPD